MPVITIRGKMGSGAPEIGKMLAEKLKYDYIDREIIAAVATRLNLQENEVIAKEMPPVTLRERIEEALQKGIAMGYVDSVILPGEEHLAVSIRGKDIPVTTATIPFLKK